MPTAISPSFKMTAWWVAISPSARKCTRSHPSRENRQSQAEPSSSSKGYRPLLQIQFPTEPAPSYSANGRFLLIEILAATDRIFHSPDTCRVASYTLPRIHLWMLAGYAASLRSPDLHCDWSHVNQGWDFLTHSRGFDLYSYILSNKIAPYKRVLFYLAEDMGLEPTGL